MARTICVVTVLLTIIGGSWASETHDLDRSPQLVSSWRSGALTFERFVAVYDPDMRLIEAGGPELREAVCKATFREIYAPRARSAGLDRDPDYLAALEQYRRTQLSALYVRRNRPELSAELTDEKLRAFYDREKTDRYTSSGSVDLGVLFLRCAEDSSGRRACDARMTGLLRKLADGEDFEQIIDEERQRSGNANGVFRRLALKSLSPDLAKIVRELPLNEYSDVLRTPIGLYLFRVSARTPAGPMAYSRVAQHVRQEAEKEALAAWEEQEVARLRLVLKADLSEGAGPDEVLAAAARAQSLDKDPGFLSSEEAWSSWELANLGLFSDREVMPEDAEIQRQLEEDPVVSRRFRLYSTKIAIVRAREDRYEMLETAGEVAEGLESAADPAAVLDSMGRTDPTIDVVDLVDRSEAEVKRIDRRMGEELLGLEPSRWSGPHAIAAAKRIREELAEAIDLDEIPSGVAFQVLEARRTPTVEEVRDEYNRYFRSSVASCDLFLAAAGDRWDLEIHPPDPPSSFLTGKQ